MIQPPPSSSSLSLILSPFSPVLLFLPCLASSLITDLWLLVCKFLLLLSSVPPSFASLVFIPLVSVVEPLARDGDGDDDDQQDSQDGHAQYQLHLLFVGRR